MSRPFDAGQEFRIFLQAARDSVTRALGVSEAFLGSDRTRSPEMQRQEHWQADYARRTDELMMALLLSRADNGESMETPASALPDKALTCCGQTWSTHAAWMAHYREAHG